MRVPDPLPPMIHAARERAMAGLLRRRHVSTLPVSSAIPARLNGRIGTAEHEPGR